MASGLALLDGLAAFLVEDVEPKIEAAQQFHEPLVHQRFRHEDQHALRAAGQDQPMQNQAGFDGFAQAHFVGEQHARHQAAGHFGSDVKLVRDQIDPAADKSAHLGFAPAMLMLQRGHPEIEDFRRIQLPGEAGVPAGLLKLMASLSSVSQQFPPAAAVEDQARPFGDRLRPRARVRPGS